MHSLAPRCAILIGALTASLSAQTVLSNFTGPSADGWTGVISGPTTFPNGSTAATGVTVTLNDVLNLSDGGFGGGALRTYTGLPTTGFVTISAMGRIVTDPGTLGPNVSSSPGTFGSSFGVAAGSTGLADQAFSYGKSLSTTADDSGQSFALYAATVRADGTGNFTAFFTPDQQDHAVGSGTWVAQFDDITLVSDCNGDEPLSNFNTGTDGWASFDALTSPFGSAFSTIAQAGGELVVTDAGFTGGAYKTYAGAAPVAGVHTVLVDVRIVTDNLSIDRARIAACVGGPTTVFSDLSFSQSFATTGDDSGQLVQTVAVPVVTSGPSDITLYLLPDYDGAIGSGAWEIRLDNISISSPAIASTAFSSTCAAGYHSLNGPVLSFPGVPTLGSHFAIDGTNLAGTVLCALIVGFEIAPIDLQQYGSFPGSQGCVQTLATIPTGGGTSTQVSIAIPGHPSFCGLPLAVQWVDYDPSMTAFPLALGNSQAATFTIGL